MHKFTHFKQENSGRQWGLSRKIVSVLVLVYCRQLSSSVTLVVHVDV